MKYLLIFFILLSYLSLRSQEIISGRVIDSETNAPVAGSSVFITNTSFAAITGKQGEFDITGIPPGIYKLVITHVGYETATYDFSTDKMPGKLKVVVRPKMVTMEPVIVGGYITETWEKWGQAFLSYFIGHSENAARTLLLNKDVIKFRFYRKLNKLEAIADEPLVIENRGLGYKISFQLERFEVYFRSGVSFFSGYPLFKDLPGRPNQVSNWADRRQEAYQGSMMHFFRSAYTNNLAEEGFEVRRAEKTRNLEKDRVRALLNIPLDRKLLFVPPLKGDSSSYYERVLSQSDYIYNIDTALLTAGKFVTRDTGSSLASWSNYLFVLNKNKLEDKRYMNPNNLNRRRNIVQSLITLTSPDPVTIDANGGWYPSHNLISEKYWSWSEKVAEMLPLNYRPAENSSQVVP